MKVNKYIANYINKNFKVCYAFSGGSIMSLIDNINIKMIIPKCESSGGFMSLGYNKSINKCDSLNIVTSGPGITNALTSITDAYCDGIPLLTISGDVSTNMKGKHAFQEAPAIELTKPITFWNYSLTNPSYTKSMLEHTKKFLEYGKQVHLNLPKDILNMDIRTNDNIELNIELDRPNYSIEDIKNIANIINNSQKPVLYVGRGCMNSKIQLKKLALLRNIPVTTTIHGLGIFNEKHFLSLKMLGMHGSERANHAIQKADCIICIGARFDDRTVGNTEFYGKNAKHIIHINNNKDVFNKVIDNTINIYGDCSDVLNDLIQYIEPKWCFYWNKNNNNLFHNEILLSCETHFENMMCESSLYNSTYYIDEWIDELLSYNINFPFDNTLLKQQHILCILNQEMYNFDRNRDVFYITGVGNHQMYSAQLITHTRPNRFITSGSLGTMGSCNSMAIGVKMANPDKIVIAIDGDQSFNMMNDLKTIMNYDIPIKILIMNDSKQSMVNIWEKLFFDNVVATETINPNYEYIAKAFNIEYINVNKNMNIDEIRINIKKFLNYNRNKSVILDCIVDSDYCFPLVPPGNALEHMITYHNFNKFDINNNYAPS